jgi:hypothetical protein
MYSFIFKALGQPLYIQRKLENTGAFVDWAESQGFIIPDPNDLHVTVAFSRKAVDWEVLPALTNILTVAAGLREVKALGPDAVVLTVSSPKLHDRWAEWLNAGASWDFPEYTPHITITFDAKDIDLSKVQPFTGVLVFGPELYSALDLDPPEQEPEQDSAQSIAEKPVPAY